MPFQYLATIHKKDLKKEVSEISRCACITVDQSHLFDSAYQSGHKFMTATKNNQHWFSLYPVIQQHVLCALTCRQVRICLVTLEKSCLTSISIDLHVPPHLGTIVGITSKLATTTSTDLLQTITLYKNGLNTLIHILHTL